MRKIYLSVAGIVFGIFQLNAQCPQISCPSNITANINPATCNAVVTYTAPVGTDPCSNTNQTFNYTGSIETFTVPAGVTSITIEARGAQGGYNTSSTTQSGLGAVMTGTFSVTPGQQLKILVGEQPSTNGGNGGGGGTFVTDMSNNPLIIAGGGGGSSQGVESPDKHGQSGTSGGTGAGDGGVGGTAGSGGSIGNTAFFQSGAGAGLLTNGADGWTSGTGGFAFINGGAGAPSNGAARGGFGGGGSGSSYVVGGGGGGYSGGGSGGNNGSGTGGGGGSFNNGTNQINTTGANSGNGLVTISYSSSATLTTTLVSGLPSGSNFPMGVNTVTYKVTNGLGDSAMCSFTVTVVDNVPPVFNNCHADTTTCNNVVNNIGPGNVSDNCSPMGTVTYILSGATTATGNNNASGTSFNVGTTLVQYIASDAVGNADTCSFNVVVEPSPVVTASVSDSVVCVTYGNVTLTGSPVSGTWSGVGVTGNSFNPATAGVGTHIVTYSYTNASGCSDSATASIQVLGCAGVNSNELNSISVYPNPAEDFLVVSGMEETGASVTITDLSGKQVLSTIQSVSNNTPLNIQQLVRGVYIVTIHTANGSASVKFIKN